MCGSKVVGCAEERPLVVRKQGRWLCGSKAVGFVEVRPLVGQTRLYINMLKVHLFQFFHDSDAVCSHCTHALRCLNREESETNVLYNYCRTLQILCWLFSLCFSVNSKV